MEPTPPGTSDTVSSQKSLPSSHDPGWNDPPEWALSSQRGADGTSTKRFLNKRVAFPLSSQSSAAGTAGGPPPSSNMPPCVSQSSLTITTAPHKPLVTPVDRDPVAIPLESNFDKDQALTKVLNNLGSVITEHRIEKSKAEEIQKKLDIMKSDWLEDKLNNAIQRSILDVSEALLREDIEQADKIHIALMTQHATVCRAWIPAVRRIILELKKNCESRISSSEHSQSPLLPVEAWEK